MIGFSFVLVRIVGYRKQYFKCKGNLSWEKLFKLSNIALEILTSIKTSHECEWRRSLKRGKPLNHKLANHKSLSEMRKTIHKTDLLCISNSSNIYKAFGTCNSAFLYSSIKLRSSLNMTEKGFTFNSPSQHPFNILQCDDQA